MHILYFSPGAASLVVHWLLIELDIPHQLRQLDLAAGEHKQPAYLSINPAGVVPTLMIDGTAHAETAALVMHLADSQPGMAPALGSADRARYYEAIVRCANGLQPAFRRWFYADAVSDATDAAALRGAVQQQIEACFARFDADLADGRSYLLGESVSAADFLLTMLMRWSRNMPKPATEFPHLAGLAARMKARPSFAKLYAREGLTEWA
ncbi:MAG: glutathione S-transferase family protein [Pseudomarimonas sp.]